MGRENGITRKMTKIISDRSPGADGEGDASERHELFIIMQKREKCASFLPRRHLALPPFHLSAEGKPEKYVMIGKEMCQRTEIRPIDGETPAKLEYVIKFVGNFPPLFRIYISSARGGWNLISEVERNRIMTML